MSAPPAERLEEIKDQVHAILVESGMHNWQTSKLASMIELIARLVLADDKQRGQS